MKKSAIAGWMRELNGPDIQREGTFSHPTDRSQGTSVDQVLEQQQENGTSLGSEVMQHAFHPKGGENTPENGMRLFVRDLILLKQRLLDAPKYMLMCWVSRWLIYTMEPS